MTPAEERANMRRLRTPDQVIRESLEAEIEFGLTLCNEAERDGYERIVESFKRGDPRRIGTVEYLTNMLNLIHRTLRRNILAIANAPVQGGES
jgi:hypothetical protein